MSFAYVTDKAAKPFLLALVPPLEEYLYSKAIAEMKALETSYDPESQTSNIPVYAGTALTYVTTLTGVLYGLDSDSEASDD